MPVYAYADPVLFRRWYPNAGKGYWGAPGSDVKGNRGGGGYSRYGSEGKGLSDTAQRTYNALKRSGLGTGYEKYKFDVEAMLIPGTNTLKGMYQLPASPKYAGGKGSFEPPKGTTSQAASQGILTQIGTPTPYSIGGMMNAGAGRGRGVGWLPAQIRRMLLQEGSELGRPPGSDGSGTAGLVGIGLLIAKVLL